MNLIIYKTCRFSVNTDALSMMVASSMSMRELIPAHETLKEIVAELGIEHNKQLQFKNLQFRILGRQPRLLILIQFAYFMNKT